MTKPTRRSYSISTKFLTPYQSHWLNTGGHYRKDPMPRFKNKAAEMTDFKNGRFVCVDGVHHWMGKKVADKMEAQND